MRAEKNERRRKRDGAYGPASLASSFLSPFFVSFGYGGFWLRPKAALGSRRHVDAEKRGAPPNNWRLFLAKTPRSQSVGNRPSPAGCAMHIFPDAGKERSPRGSGAIAAVGSGVPSLKLDLVPDPRIPPIVGRREVASLPQQSVSLSYWGHRARIATTSSGRQGRNTVQRRSRPD